MVAASAINIDGSMSTMDLRPIEKAKIDCARKLFNDVSTSKVRYEAVDNYKSLLNVIISID